MQSREIFGIPLYKSKFDLHKELKPSFVNYLSDKNLYSRNSSHEYLRLSQPNLHKEEIMQPFVNFVNENVALAMVDLGFVPNFEMTGLWSTIHNRNGFHHRHMHFNSFLAGVYYLDGPANSAGTTFFNTHQHYNIIYPARIPNTPCKYRSTEITPFEEGTLIIFPAWMQHETTRNLSSEKRMILSFNIMPVGKTTQDTYDRYNYQSIQDAEMISYNDQRIR
jgi:uncharacterized protein (TIGR02466 family)